VKATVAAVLVGGALGLGACGDDEESSSSTVGSATSTTASEASTTTGAPNAGVLSGLSDPRPEADVQEGSVRSALPERVAGLTLVDVTDAPALVKGGALDAAVAVYAHYDELGPTVGDVANPKRFNAEELRHELAVFPSPEAAESWRQRVVEYVTKDSADAGYQIDGERPVTRQDGNQAGTATSLRRGRDRTIVWTNGAVYGAVDGFGQNGALVLGFYSELPY
jgi:hypothetical protein